MEKQLFFIDSIKLRSDPVIDEVRLRLFFGTLMRSLIEIDDLAALVEKAKEQCFYEETEVRLDLGSLKYHNYCYITIGTGIVILRRVNYLLTRDFIETL